MKLSELPDDFTPEQFMQLDADALNQLPYSVHKLYCGFKNCNCNTKIRDYGVDPFYLLHRNSKSFLNNPKKYWWNLNKQFMLCYKHFGFYKRMEARFGNEHTNKKLFRGTNIIIPVKAMNQGVEKINEHDY